MLSTDVLVVTNGYCVQKLSLVEQERAISAPARTPMRSKFLFLLFLETDFFGYVHRRRTGSPVLLAPVLYIIVFHHAAIRNKTYGAHRCTQRMLLLEEMTIRYYLKRNKGRLLN
jgi:hypothetical protein